MNFTLGEEILDLQYHLQDLSWCLDHHEASRYLDTLLTSPCFYSYSSFDFTLLEELSLHGEKGEDAPSSPISKAPHDCLSTLASFTAKGGVATVVEPVIVTALYAPEWNEVEPMAKGVESSTSGTVDVAVGTSGGSSTVNHPWPRWGKNRTQKKGWVKYKITSQLSLLHNSKGGSSPKWAHVYPSADIGLVEVLGPSVEVLPVRCLRWGGIVFCPQYDLSLGDLYEVQGM
ncbi:hypothetical protein HOY80DRAFT_1031386 [Tuber brumale]|nr:hypothetical protein HOY80DRAFT_1031386 [Tuber brumale]